MTWFTFFITFFNLSLIEININIFTQIANLTFSSGFAVFGAFASAVFLALEFLVIGLLWMKIREEGLKPEWMRNYAYTAPIYLIRTNYKTVTKYFWVIHSTKKILMALFTVMYYHHPDSAIISAGTIQIIYVMVCIYCEPYERRVLRIHLYLIEMLKGVLYFSMLNFTQKYESYVQMISMTMVLYTNLAMIFGCNLFFILAHLMMERDWYVRAISQKCDKDNEDNQYLKGRLGYYSEGRLYVYEK